MRPVDTRQNQQDRPLFQLQRNNPCYCGSGQRFKSCCGSLAEPRLPPHGVHIVPNFLAGETCRQWVSYLAQQARRPLSINEVARDSASGVSLKRDSGRVTDVVEQGDLSEAIEATIRSAFLQEVSAGMGGSMAWMEAPQVLRYEPGGLYGPHADAEHFNAATGLWQRVLDRDASLLLYLNQDFSGGELAFPQFNYRYQPRVGDLLFFPSHGHYAHQALPVTAGVRYVIVSWAAFRESPRVQVQPPAGFIGL
jgi:predicted 2-oxoglutarate/Fe(II)-dependent dioxygenase YbiX